MNVKQPSWRTGGQNVGAPDDQEIEHTKAGRLEEALPSRPNDAWVGGPRPDDSNHQS